VRVAGNDLDLDEAAELYHASTLGERRPIDDRAILLDMLRHANLVVTAWDGGLLVGIARTLSDFSLRRQSLRSGCARFASAPRHRRRADTENPRQNGAALHAGAAFGAQAVGYYPKSASRGMKVPGCSAPASRFVRLVDFTPTHCFKPMAF
jgi:hypothetical protein